MTFGPVHTSDQFLFSTFPKWWSLIQLWFTGSEKWKARGYAALVILCALCTTILSVQISYAQRNFSTALSGKDAAGFYRALVQFVIIILFVAPFQALTGFFEENLVLSWRSYLTKTLLSIYFNKKSYYFIKQQIFYSAIDNPDQRICDDIAAFVRSSVSIVLALIKKFFMCIAFSGVLWGISGNLVIFLLTYSVFGTIVTTSIFGRILTRLYYRLLKSEGDLRFSIVRAGENAESIAFYNGEIYESSVILQRLHTLVDAISQRIKWSALYELWTNFYNYATILLPSLLTAPRYFSGEIEFGVITQTSYAFSRIDDALSIIINNLSQISGLSAETDRLHSLMSAMESVSLASIGVQRSTTQPGGTLVIDDLHIFTPGSKSCLCRGLSLHLAAGSALLIMGPSGCGKSSVLRTLAGLWNEGSGSISLPPSYSTFFLPQKPYMPLGSLRDVLRFPSGTKWENESSRANESQAAQAHKQMETEEDATLLAALHSVGLGKLTTEEHSLDVELDWTNVLSLGEQQRIAIARLLLARPLLAVLDEATSALDLTAEASLYALLKEHVPLIVSVGHRPQLLQYHTHVLECKGDAVWMFCKKADFLNQRNLL